jgi:hypothetical protein
MKELEALLFDGVIKQRKIRYINGQDYPYTRKMDDKAWVANTNWPSTSSPPSATTMTISRCSACRAWGATNCGWSCPPMSRFMQDLTMHKRTEKYIRQNSNTQQEIVKRILDAKGFQNTERLRSYCNALKILLGQAQLIINAGDVEVGGEDGQARILKGFHQLIEITYPNLRMLRDVPFNEADVGKYLRHSRTACWATTPPA